MKRKNSQQILQQPKIYLKLIRRRSLPTERRISPIEPLSNVSSVSLQNIGYRNVANFDISAQLYIYLTNNGMKTFNITKLCTVHIITV